MCDSLYFQPHQNFAFTIISFSQCKHKAKWHFVQVLLNPVPFLQHRYTTEQELSIPDYQTISVKCGSDYYMPNTREPISETFTESIKSLKKK